MKLIKSLLVIFLLISTLNACGMLVHMDVTERALNSFKGYGDYDYVKLTKKYHSYMMAGSPFPDWGYLC